MQYKRRRVVGSEANPKASSSDDVVAMDKLGDDLLVEVLIRSFPNPKPAHRCKLVSKRWRSLISDPVLFNRRFVSHHKSMFTPEPPLIITPSPSSSSTFRQHYPSLGFLPVPDELGPDFKVWDSFQDLLLCGFWGEGVNKSRGMFGRFYFVCNPFTKQWVALPLAPERPDGTELFAAWLACEPINTTSLDLGGDDDDGQAAAVLHQSYSEYRFRVACVYHAEKMRADVFCFESGEWTNEALVPNVETKIIPRDGKIFYAFTRMENLPCGKLSYLTLCVVSPFRLDVRQARTHDSLVFPNPTVLRITVSRGVLHAVLLELEHKGCSRNALTVLRLEEDGKSWRKLHEAVLLEESVSSSSIRKYELEQCFKVGLHPQKPEIVYLYFDDHGDRESVSILSYDLTGKGEVEFVDVNRPCWKAFQPKVSCWPTPIPRYEELRSAYDERYNYLLRASKTTVFGYKR